MAQQTTGCPTGKLPALTEMVWHQPPVAKTTSATRMSLKHAPFGNPIRADQSRFTIQIYRQRLVENLFGTNDRGGTASCASLFEHQKPFLLLFLVLILNSVSTRNEVCTVHRQDWLLICIALTADRNVTVGPGYDLRRLNIRW